jgi:hypothetical protein
MSKTVRLFLLGSTALCAGALGFWAGMLSAQEQKAKPRLYELRIYTTHPGRLPALHARFKNHTIKLFEKHGMKNHMYWTPTDEKLRENTLIYVVSHESAEAADKSWKSFIDDPEWKKVAAESEKDGKIVAKVDRQYMTLVDYSPEKE